MKRNTLKCLIIAMLFSFSACKKSVYNNNISGIASLNIALAVVNVSAVTVNLSTEPIPFYQNQVVLFNGSASTYGLPAGNSPLTFVDLQDTTKALSSVSVSLDANGIYSLYLSGVLPNIDTVLTKDIIPVYSDSSAGVRIVNLVSDAKQPISVNLSGSSANEFENISYRQTTPFKKYPAGNTIGGTYAFEIKDQLSGTILQTFTWQYTVGRNNTIVIIGLESDNSVNAFLINNY